MSTPEEIRAEIEQTRANLSADVDALTEEANPKNIAKRQVDKVKDATVSVKDRIMGSAEDATSSVKDAVSNVKDKVMGGSSDGPSAVDQAKGTAMDVKDRALDVRDRVAGSASQAGDALAAAPSAVRQRAQGNPLVAGLVAFGLGFLVSSAIPSTRKEQDAAAAVKDKAEPLKQELTDIGKDAVGNLKESAQDAVQSVKETATDAAQTVKQEGTSAASDVQGQVQQSKQAVQETRS